MKKLLAATAALVLAAGVGSAAAPAPPRAAALRAGAAKVDITPTPDMFPLISGQTFGSVHDPLFARALVLDNGVDKVVLVTADISGIPRGDELLDAVANAINVPRDHVLLSATHNHNSPTVGADSPGQPRMASPPVAAYIELLKAGIVKAARLADARLAPARIGYGTGKAYVNTNRDEKIGAGYHMGYAPDGPSDKTVAVLAVTTPAGVPIAVYANYAVHGVVMYLAKTKDGQVQITGDLPGATSAYVEDRLGNGAVALWTSGAAGDQNPLFMATYNQDAPDVTDEGPADWAILDVQARRLGEEIVRVAGGIRNTTTQPALWGAEASITCPGQNRAQSLQPGEPAGGYRAAATVAMVDGPPVVVPLHLLMIGDVALAGVSAEVYSEIGQDVKRTSRFDRTMMVTLLPNRVGYIPTDKAYLLPSEKVIANRLKPGCAEPAMVDAFRRLEDQYLARRR